MTNPDFSIVILVCHGGRFYPKLWNMAVPKEVAAAVAIRDLFTIAPAMKAIVSSGLR